MAKKTEKSVDEAQVENAPSPQLNINDIQTAVALIDLACEQGAYKGWNTVRTAFEIREKFAAFVMSVSVPVAPGEEGGE